MLSLSLLPLALGIVLSPLAVIAAVAVLFSARANVNSIAYLAGWILGIVAGVGGAYAILTALGVDERRHSTEPEGSHNRHRDCRRCSNRSAG